MKKEDIKSIHRVDGKTIVRWALIRLLSKTMKDYGIYINVLYVIALNTLISITLKLFQPNFNL